MSSHSTTFARKTTRIPSTSPLWAKSKTLRAAIYGHNPKTVSAILTSYAVQNPVTGFNGWPYAEVLLSDLGPGSKREERWERYQEAMSSPYLECFVLRQTLARFGDPYYSVEFCGTVVRAL